jgi:hypothetical protein
VNRKEITGATIRNYIKSNKLVCEMADISIPWQKITRSLLQEGDMQTIKSPPIGDIRMISEYPDRRIKAIVCTITSTGIVTSSQGLDLAALLTVAFG